MAIANIDPRDNPLAIAIEFDTLINNVSLSEGEMYTVTGPTFGSIGTDAINKNFQKIHDRSGIPHIKDIYLTGAHWNWIFSIHYPKPDTPNVLYMVPAKRNTDYDGGYQELTEASQLDTPFASSYEQTWRQAAKEWITKMAGPGSSSAGSASGTLTQKLGFTVIGNDTNQTEKQANFEIKLKHLTSV